MTTRQPGQPGVTIDQLGYLRHDDDPYPTKTNDTGDSGVGPPGGLTVTAQSTGGTITDSTTVSYQVTATTDAGESTPQTAVTDVTGTPGDTSSADLEWNAVPGATGYNVYGRIAASEGLLTSIADPETLTWTDDGSGSPGAAPPEENTSGDLAAGMETAQHTPGTVPGQQVVRPTVDTRNAEFVGDPSGPDDEAPRTWS